MRYIYTAHTPKFRTKAQRRFIFTLAHPKAHTPSSAPCVVCGGELLPVKCDMLCLRCLGVDADNDIGIA